MVILAKNILRFYYIYGIMRSSYTVYCVSIVSASEVPL